MNTELLNTLFSNIPNNLTKLEQAIFLYIKLCKLLTYDELFYVMNEDAIKYHENINNLKNITLENNKVVCYEFNILYAEVLDRLGIKYQIQDYSKGNSRKGHANLIFKSDDFIVTADSVTSILMGDLTNAKLGYPLVGLTCKNNPQEFEKLISKVYQNPVIETKNSLLTNNDNSLFSRFKIIITNVLEKNLALIDAYSYLLILRNSLFNYDEKLSNFRVSLVKNNKTLKPLMILTLNEYDFENEEDETRYYYFDSNSLTETSVEEIRTNFLNDTFSYFENDLARIPNINIKVLKR